jgi:hypothetical protein
LLWPSDLLVRVGGSKKSCHESLGNAAALRQGLGESRQLFFTVALFADFFSAPDGKAWVNLVLAHSLVKRFRQFELCYAVCFG